VTSDVNIANMSAHGTQQPYAALSLHNCPKKELCSLLLACRNICYLEVLLLRSWGRAPSQPSPIPSEAINHIH
jgi:hypothetical protein